MKGKVVRMIWMGPEWIKGEIGFYEKWQVK